MAEAYDVITIGGGLAGSALAKRLAENGMRVLVLEREVASVAGGAASASSVIPKAWSSPEF